MAEIRYKTKGNTKTAEARMAEAYKSGAFGKSSFIGDCLSVGFMMKEAGFTDLLKMLDLSPSFHDLPPMAKRENIIALMSGEKLPEAQGLPIEDLATTAPQAVAAPKEIAVPKAALPKLGQ
jgi:hypothetical protein